MDLGTILIILGIVFAVLDFFIPYERYRGANGRWEGGLLTLAVILIGVGVLVGGTTISSTTH